MTSEPIEDEGDRERRQRYEETERELLAVLEAESVDESTRKRQLVGLFDRFRSEFTQLSVKLRESLRLQRRLMDKCLQMKNELVVCALKIKTTEQVQADEIKSLVFYRDECEFAWRQSALSQERERDAMRIIDELKTNVETLQLQVKALVVTGAASAAPSARRRPHTEFCPDPLLSTPPVSPPKLHSTRLSSPLLSSAGTSSVLPVKRTKLRSNGSPSSLSMPQLLSFDEWKSATNVWSPATPLALGGSSRAAPTPSKDSIHASERQQEIARCVSVPSLHPTPMERVSSPQQQQRQQQERLNSTNSIGAIRAATAPNLVAPVRASIQTSESSLLARRGGTPAIKRRVPRQLPHVQ
ncbi:hypothetical protein PHYPSEUDO_011827 [Phytophthora pseudosyringae]|uniref:Uncharacterized protein n=1 Tax=Phytophthora pseudosyringae TaxID=221518 RepID=A0A8T1VB71_9STRA|nr:hypothetical protein PHYPSEUDO_011827 [Phytophthora pseudosyringae]